MSPLFYLRLKPHSKDVVPNGLRHSLQTGASSTSATCNSLLSNKTYFLVFFILFRAGGWIGQVGRYIPPAWLLHTEVTDWASEVEKLWPDLVSKELQELEILFVEQCRDRLVL